MEQCCSPLQLLLPVRRLVLLLPSHDEVILFTAILLTAPQAMMRLHDRDGSGCAPALLHALQLLLVVPVLSSSWALTRRLTAALSLLCLQAHQL